MGLEETFEQVKAKYRAEREAGPPQGAPESVPDPVKPWVGLEQLKEAVAPEAEKPEEVEGQKPEAEPGVVKKIEGPSADPPSPTPSTATSKKWISKRRLIGIGAVVAVVVPLLVFVVLPIAQGSTRLLVVMSGSMSPAMEPGDIVAITQVDPSEVKVGDIIAYEHDGNPQSMTTHRVIEVVPNGEPSFRTKGDANEDPDQRLVGASSVVGRVSLTIPKLGYLFHYARQPVGFCLLVVLPASLLIALEVKHLRGQVSKPQSKRKVDPGDEAKGKHMIP